MGPSEQQDHKNLRSISAFALISTPPSPVIPHNPDSALRPVTLSAESQMKDCKKLLKYKLRAGDHHMCCD